MFEFATATRIVFGRGAVSELGKAARHWGRRPLVVTGADPTRVAARELAGEVLAVSGEPTVGQVRAGVERGRAMGCDSVIAVGGGSAIDAGKAIAALLANDGDVLDYLEVIGAGKPLLRHPVPFIAVPTTAGTGSEVTRNAVLASPEHRVKASLRNQHMLPALALIDPELTYDLPRDITASTGLDALTQVIEPYVSGKANAMTDMFCLEGIRRGAPALRRVWQNGADAAAREDMSFTSLLGGLALANAGLGIVHGLAAPIGGMFPAPHGAVCAALLPAAVAVNIRALRERAAQSEALLRYGAIARLLTGNAHAQAEDAAVFLRELCSELEIPPLRAYGMTAVDVPELVAKAANASSTKGNPIALTPAEMAEVLSAAL